MSLLLLLILKSCHELFGKELFFKLVKKALLFLWKSGFIEIIKKMYPLPDFFKLQNLLFGGNIFMKRRIAMNSPENYRIKELNCHC